MNKLAYPLMIIMLGSSVACTNMSNEEQGTLTGGAIGALVGAGIANATGGNGWTGAAVGAIAGGIVGNMKGKEAD
jgi:osmotically inducible lipoprotein OsmB